MNKKTKTQMATSEMNDNWLTRPLANKWYDHVRPLTDTVVAMIAFAALVLMFGLGVMLFPIKLLRARYGHINDPSSATRPTRRVDCNRSAMAGFAAAHG